MSPILIATDGLIPFDVLGAATRGYLSGLGVSVPEAYFELIGTPAAGLLTGAPFSGWLVGDPAEVASLIAALSDASLAGDPAYGSITARPSLASIVADPTEIPVTAIPGVRNLIPQPSQVSIDGAPTDEDITSNDC